MQEKRISSKPWYFATESQIISIHRPALFNTYVEEFFDSYNIPFTP